MSSCIQCGKPGIFQVGGNPLCIDCSLKIQQILEMQDARLVQEMNYLTDEIEAAVGLYGVLPRYKRFLSL
jgi:hypothetical protein